MEIQQLEDAFKSVLSDILRITIQTNVLKYAQLIHLDIMEQGNVYLIVLFQKVYMLILSLICVLIHVQMVILEAVFPKLVSRLAILIIGVTH